MSGAIRPPRRDCPRDRTQDATRSPQISATRSKTFSRFVAGEDQRAAKAARHRMREDVWRPLNPRIRSAELLPFATPVIAYT